MTTPGPAHAREEGFTLVELLVVMVLTTLVGLASLQAFDVFASTTARQTRVTAANDRARTIMDRTVDDLRGAATIRTATATDLVYSVVRTAGTRSQRLCVAGDRGLYSSTSTTANAPGAACGSVDTGWTQGRIATLPASASGPFTYDGAASSPTPATVRDVGLTIQVQANVGGRSSVSTLRSSATIRRAAGTLALDDGDVRATCNSSGALLGLAAAASGGSGPLGVTYRTSSGVVLGSGTSATPVQIPKGVTNVVATVTDAAGVTTTLQAVVECS